MTPTLCKITLATLEIDLEATHGRAQFYHETTGAQSRQDEQTTPGFSIANHDAITDRVFAEDWGLDATGNWDDFAQDADGDGTADLDQTRAHNAVNETGTIGATAGTDWADPGHDGVGNMTSMPKPFDPAGSIAAKYDAWNRLVEVSDGGVLIAKFRYDGQGRRILKMFDSQSPAGPDGLDSYEHIFLSGNQVVETRQGTLAQPTDAPAEAEGLQPKYQNLWSPRYIDSLILRDANTDADGLCDDARLYYLADANYNVTALVGRVETEPGVFDWQVVERYQYSPYGRVTILDPDFLPDADGLSDHSNTTLYTGRTLDPAAGLMYYRARYYHAGLGRFVGRDPIGYEHGINLYEYVRNNPIVFVDPDGYGPLPGFGYSPFPGWPWPDPLYPPSPPDPRYTSGFKLCQRDIQKTGGCCEDAATGVISTCFAQHCYIQYGALNKDGTAAEGTVGWGISGGGVGTLPAAEKAFNADSCTSLSKGTSRLKYGKGAGKRGSKATEDEIKDCISKAPMSKKYEPWGKDRYNCYDWAKEAAAACGLE